MDYKKNTSVLIPIPPKSYANIGLRLRFLLCCDYAIYNFMDEEYQEPVPVPV